MYKNAVYFYSMTTLYPRWQKPRITEALKSRRVLLLSGPRQCGKTTLAKQLVSAKTAYRTLDDISLRKLAQEDPNDFVNFKNGYQTLIIDEIQKAPELLSAIKLIVDQDTRPGQFLLTGSANIQSLPGVNESLAGRIRKLRLRPLSQGEILHSKPLFLERAFEQNFPKRARQTFNRNDILEAALRGGFPEVINLKSRERKQWHRDYLDALVERDLQDITRISRLDAIRELFKVLAAWSSKYMEISAISSGLSVGRATVESYINAIEALYLVERVRPWTKTDYERVGKHSKIFMTDSGLMASCLEWKKEQVESDPDRMGKIVETFVFNELAAQIDASETGFSLYHYRDREKREIDFLIEREDSTLLGIEVKSSSTIRDEHFKHLRWFKNNIAGKKSFTGIVLYTGEYAGSMGDGMWAAPISTLWT